MYTCEVMTKKKHILMLLESSFPPDIRVEKEINTLTKNSFTVSILCYRKNKHKTKHIFNNATVLNYISQSYFQRIKAKLSMLFTFIHPNFLAEMKLFYDQKPFDMIHVHDLPLSKTALTFQKYHPKIKVILDFHENYPEALLVWNEWNKGLKTCINKYIFHRYKRWLHYEKKVIAQADHVIAVVKEMKERLINIHNVSENQISIVSNTEPKSFDQLPIDQTIMNTYKNDFIISYIGGFGPHRGIDTAILGMSKLKQNIPIKLLLIGKGNHDIESKFKSLIKSNHLSEHVLILGWQPFEKVSSYIAASNICIVPHKNNPHTANTVPHKLFQYMMKGKPVLVSSCAPLKRIVEETQSGLVFEADNPRDFAKKVMLFFDNPKLLQQSSENGKLATSKNIYNWQHDAHNLLKVYKMQ